MKGIRIAVLGLALALTSTAASAQGGGGGGGGGGRGGRGGNMLMVGIDSTLTAEQKTKLGEINAKYMPDLAAVRELMATDREGAMKKRAEITAKQNPEIRAILTPAQQAIFDKNVADAAARAAAPRPAAPPAL